MLAESGTMVATGQIEQVNHGIHEYGESVRRFFREQQRSSLVSPLFNIPGRMVLGAYCYYENLGRLLHFITSHEDPESIALRMKRPCSLPNAINIHSLMLGYFNGREQSRLLGGPVADNPEEIVALLDFWGRVTSVYHEEQAHLPDATEFRMRVLPQAQVESVSHLLRKPSPDEQNAIRRMMATLELLTFIMNGESRIGVFHHGPYPLSDGDVLVFKELVGLQEDYYSWATPDVRLPVPAIARVTRLRGVSVNIVLMGSMTTEPANYQERIVAEELFACEEGTLRPLGADEVAKITQSAADAQMELYRRMLAWDDRYRVAYGAELYGQILGRFAPPRQEQKFRAMIRDACSQSVAKHADDLASGKEPPLILQHIASTAGPIYAPVAT
jgi:hypothetical protein